MVSNIVTYFLSIILLIAGLAVMMYSYSKEHDCSYKFRNTFPYELIKTKINSFTTAGKIVLILSWIALAIFFVVYPFGSELGIIKAIAAFVSVFGVMAIFAFGALFYTDTSNVKVHLLATTFLFVFSFMLNVAIAFMGFWTLRAFHDPNDIDIKKIVCSSIAVVLFIIQIIALVNPKLRNWAKLEEKSNEDGSKIYLRPKYFALAYSEWLFGLSVYFDAMLLFIMFI